MAGLYVKSGRVIGEAMWKGADGNGTALMDAVQRLNRGRSEGSDVEICLRHWWKGYFNGAGSWLSTLLRG
jgi:hypothetical protein